MDFVAEWIHNEGTGMHTQWAQRLTLSGMSVGLLLAARQFLKRRNALKLQGQVVLITGSSRGLGLALAHEFARQGARLVICARQAKPLELARQQPASMGAEVLAIPCDFPGLTTDILSLVNRALPGARETEKTPMTERESRSDGATWLTGLRWLYSCLLGAERIMTSKIIPQVEQYSEYKGNSPYSRA